MSAQRPTTHPYTCLACALAFTTAQTQRSHYSTELHRYNSKRAVAGLTPIDLTTFNQKFSQIYSNGTPSELDNRPALRCHPCHKSFNTENAYHNHLSSKKHIHQTTSNLNSAPETEKSEPSQLKHEHLAVTSPLAHASHLHSVGLSGESPQFKASRMDLGPVSSTQEPSDNPALGSLLDRLIQLRVDQAPEINPNQCLFCPHSKNPTQFKDVDHALKHMLTQHGFFLPDQEFLVDKVGLLKYLAQTISVWNVCIYCGTGFGGKMQDEAAESQDFAAATRNGLNSVRKHMCDKNHCKLAWDTEADRLEYSVFFDYRPSYKNHSKPNSDKKTLRKSAPVARYKTGLEEEEGSEWEDEDEPMKSDDGSIGTEEEEERTASFGDSMFELVLPNGVRLGHRSLRHIYKQNLLPYSVGSQSTAAGNRNINLITRMAILSNQSSSSLTKLDNQSILLNKLGGAKSANSMTKSALIPARGGGINFNHPNSGDHQVIKAKDSGQAQFAGHHIRTFKDTHKKLQFQNRVSCKSGNNQKHYRDPLLQ